MQIAAIGNLWIHYSVVGPADGLPIVFANSLGTDFRIWDAVPPRLPAGLRILRYDMRGHGLSDAPPGEYAIADLVADVSGLMDQLGFTGAVFVGLSIGGLVAQGLAANRPDLVRALVLSNTAARIGSAESWAQRIAAVRADGVASIADGILEKWFTPAFRAERADELAGWRNMLIRTPVEGYVGCCAALAGADLRASTAALKLPVLAVAGSEDGSTPPDLVRETAASIAGARFEVIPDVGHIPCVQTPDALAALISDFLREHRLV